MVTPCIDEGLFALFSLVLLTVVIIIIVVIVDVFVVVAVVCACMCIIVQALRIRRVWPAQVAVKLTANT